MASLRSVRYLLLCSLVITAISLMALTPVDPVFRKLWFLVGLWRMDTGKGLIFEEWSKIDDNSLAGRSYNVDGSDTVVWETIRLAVDADGIGYTVTGPNGDESVRFQLTEHTDYRFLFENPKHDFPQRIIYTLITADSVVARIEGMSKGKPAGSNFYFRRMR
jgi:hypothetical protein